MTKNKKLNGILRVLDDGVMHTTVFFFITTANNLGMFQLDYKIIVSKGNNEMGGCDTIISLAC